MPEITIALTTVDGNMSVRVFEPQALRRKGGVVFYMDAFGWRPELDGMCRRYAEAGYVVFMADLYYRRSIARFAVPASESVPLDPEMMMANVATTVEMTIADTSVLLGHALANGAYGVTSFGAVGYCMGARHALGAAASHSDLIKAVGCLHGGKLVWDGENSPHLYIPKVKGGLYFGFAAHDPTCPDEHKMLIEETIAESKVRGRTEYYQARHGWTFPQRWCYDHAAAELAFERVLALFSNEFGH